MTLGLKNLVEEIFEHCNYSTSGVRVEIVSTIICSFNFGQSSHSVVVQCLWSQFHRPLNNY